MIPLDTALLSAMPWILSSSLVEAGALTLLRIGGKWNVLYAAAIFACAVVPLLSKALEWQGVGMVNFIWNVFSTFLMFSIGYFFFDEKLTYLKLVGISSCIFGIGILLLVE
jgi:multidrug transporter EmrE-like cation transporter